MSDPRRVLAFYKFHTIEDPSALCEVLQREGMGLKIKGTILLAHEGINATVVAQKHALVQLQQLVTQHVGEVIYKWSELNPDNLGFNRFKVRVKPEIVSFGIDDLEVHQTGDHVDAAQWHALIDDPDVVVIDTRNQYEINIGSFPSAVSPRTTNFREFPDWVAKTLDPAKQKKVAMFCTGGIRCEKASAYMLQQGFAEVYQLDGGILNYLECVGEEENRWQGECFVFDQRVSVDAKLQQGRYKQCFACRHPLSAQDLASASFEQGVACPHCTQKVDEVRKNQFRDRQHQVELAAARGHQHIGESQVKASRK